MNIEYCRIFPSNTTSPIMSGLVTRFLPWHTLSLVKLMKMIPGPSKELQSMHVRGRCISSCEVRVLSCMSGVCAFDDLNSVIASLCVSCVFVV